MAEYVFTGSWHTWPTDKPTNSDNYLVTLETIYSDWTTNTKVDIRRYDGVKWADMPAYTRVKAWMPVPEKYAG